MGARSRVSADTKHAREMGEENREYDAQIAARRSQDPFGIPPRGGMDLAAVEYDAQAEQPRGGLGRWLSRLGIIADRQAQPDSRQPRVNDSPPSPT
jgi:hypothetical protein